MPRRTTAREVECNGVALHAGSSVRARLLPAQSGGGIVFRRDDLDGVEIPARYDRVSEARLGTVISEGSASVGVIEHLMAAVFGAGIDDLVVALNGPEPPVLDGDALCWLELLERGGTREMAGERSAIRIARRVAVENDHASAALSPSDMLSFDFHIRFDSAAVGAQHLFWKFS